MDKVYDKGCVEGILSRSSNGICLSAVEAAVAPESGLRHQEKP